MNLVGTVKFLNVQKRAALFKGNASELMTGLDAPDRAMLPGCLTLPRSEIRDLPGILSSSG
jgi:hypothetical protein